MLATVAKPGPEKRGPGLRLAGRKGYVGGGGGKAPQGARRTERGAGVDWLEHGA